MKSARVRNFSALEVANLCGVVNQTAINWIRKNYLHAHMTPGGQYRVYGEDLASFMVSRGMKLPEELRPFVSVRQKSVLMIDSDGLFVRHFLSELKAEFPGCETDRAGDGFEAGIKLAGKRRDLILLCCDTAGLDPLKVCRSIRSGSGSEGISIIAYTENFDTRQYRSLVEAGADVYIAKPFDMGKISFYLE